MQEVMFKKEDSTRNYGVYDFLKRPDFDTKNLGAFNDNGYIYDTNHSTDNWKIDHYNEVIGDYNLYFSVVKNTIGLDYQLCIYYKHEHDTKIRQASLFELECAISLVYEYLAYMIENNLKPGIYITCSCLTDNKENDDIEDISYYNSTYVKNDKEAIGLEECSNLYHKLVEIHNSRIYEDSIEEKKRIINNVKVTEVIDNIKERIKNTRLYKHYHNKYIIDKYQKRLKHN